MTIFMAASLSALMIGTALLSGVFGMAGGLILIGVLLTLFPVPQAMVLHAVTQMASNGWRALLWWRHIVWRSMAVYVAGCLVAVGLWSMTLYVPDKAVALLMLGASPFVIRAIPEKILPRTFGPAQVAGTGFVSMMLMLVTGVTGPLLDTMFLRSPLERRQIIAPSASACSADLASRAWWPRCTPSKLPSATAPPFQAAGVSCQCSKTGVIWPDPFKRGDAARAPRLRRRSRPCRR